MLISMDKFKRKEIKCMLIKKIKSHPLSAVVRMTKEATASFISHNEYLKLRLDCFGAGGPEPIPYNMSMK